MKTILPTISGIPSVARDDLAEAIAKILTASTNIYQNRTIILTVSKLYTLKVLNVIVWY